MDNVYEYQKRLETLLERLATGYWVYNDYYSQNRCSLCHCIVHSNESHDSDCPKIVAMELLKEQEHDR